jgi:hypothetical protein
VGIAGPYSRYALAFHNLQQLLADVKFGKIDVIVVYKVEAFCRISGKPS